MNKNIDKLGTLLERAKGIEPSWSAWEAAALPLCYARDGTTYTLIFPKSQAFFINFDFAQTFILRF